MTDKTIIYYTDNRLDPAIDGFCRAALLRAAGDTPIISVSQKPIALGRNICVGDIGASWLNLYRQLMAGVEAAETKWVGMAEHDCLYTEEHIAWTPPRDDIFFYNENCWFLQWGGNHPTLNGMFSSWWGPEPRFALSQLVCSRDLLLASLRERLNLLDEEKWVKRSILFAGEPGVARVRNAQALAKSGRGVSLLDRIRDFLSAETAATFRTESPNVDIRHGKNFTGPKRGKNRTYTLAPWGDLRERILCAPCVQLLNP